MNGSALNYDDYRSSKYFAALDGLRALSALLVLSVHIGGDEQWGWLSGSGGVAIFFVLSGFVITTLALREEDQRGSLSLKAFYIRRIFRIFPLYYAVLTGTYLYSLGLPDPVAKQAMNAAAPYYYTYLGEFAPSAPFYHSWSLGIEEKFYLLWPLIAFVLLLGNPRRRLICAGLLACAPLLAPILPGSVYWSDYSRIMAGCLLGLLLHDRRWFLKLRVLARPVWLYVGLLSFLFAHTLRSHKFMVEKDWRDHLYTLTITLFLLGLVVAKPWWGRLLSTRPLRFVGERAYGIYILQLWCVWPVVTILRPISHTALGSASTYILSAVVAVTLADVCYRLIERPFVLEGRRLSNRILGAEEEKTRPADIEAAERKRAATAA